MSDALHPLPTTHAPKGVTVSIVIVCMNHLVDLQRCLDSIRQHTTGITYEIWVVAYLFTPENLKELRRLYPDIHIIESNELRGFAENNNLALRQANGEFCLLVNDDTYMEMPVINMLLESFQSHPEAAIFSPKVLNPDGSVQFCGGLPHTMAHWILVEFKLLDPPKVKSPYINQPHIFQTCNILGAAFMVRTTVMRELNYLDEQYFFCPEDTAFSTLANRRGYKCFVNSDACIFHKHSTTLSRYALPTVLAMRRGQILFHSKNSVFLWLFGTSAMFVAAAIKLVYWSCFSHAEDRHVRSRIWWKAMWMSFSRQTPKAIFARYFQQITAEKRNSSTNQTHGKGWS